MKYKVGDEVLVKGKIIQNDEGSVFPHLVEINHLGGMWCNETEIADKTYTQGLADAWELVRKIYSEYDGYERRNVLGFADYANVLELMTPEEALAKIEAYEREKEIKVKDIVKFASNGDIGCVTYSGSETAYVMFEDGRSGNYRKDIMKKTGRTAESLDLLLRQIGE